MKYNVTVPFLVYVTACVEADSEDEAIEEVVNDVNLTNYCGNGGSDRLIGSYDTDHTIEPGDLYEDLKKGIKVEAEISEDQDD